MTTPEDPTLAILNGLLGAYWTGTIQHQTHVSVLESQGLHGLAAAMRTHIDDEPETIQKLTDRLLELGGTPDFTVGPPRIGTTLEEILRNDLAAQKDTKPGLNAAAEAVAHDATTRNLVEELLLDEENHLDWLSTEVELYERIGEPLYIANRLS